MFIFFHFIILYHFFHCVCYSLPLVIFLVYFIFISTNTPCHHFPFPPSQFLQKVFFFLISIVSQLWKVCKTQIIYIIFLYYISTYVFSIAQIYLFSFTFRYNIFIFLRLLFIPLFIYDGSGVSFTQSMKY